MLKDTTRHVFLNAGHWDDHLTAKIDDPGAVHNGFVEAVETMRIRDALVPILHARGYTVTEVPDELDLKKSIDFVNASAHDLDDGLAVDIHLNASSDVTARGVEGYHGESETSKQVAGVISSETARVLGIPNRGAKPDTATHVGSLGWIRKTNCWATLVEVCFITNKQDMDVLRGVGGYEKAARGIADGIDSAFGREPVAEDPGISAKQSWSIKVKIMEVERLCREIRTLLG